MRTLCFLLLCLPLSADVLVLRDGRKLSGQVTEKEKSYEIRLQGETLVFAKDEVASWFKHPKEMTGEADRGIEEAKKKYLEALELKDEAAARAKFEEALPLVQKARDIYAEARDLFPDGYPELDEKLVITMSLMRLVRERLGSKIAGTKSPVVPRKKTEPKSEPPKDPKTEPKKPEPKSDPAPEREPEPEPKPRRQVVLREALAIFADPVQRRNDEARLAARECFRALAESDGDLSDLGAAFFALLSRDEREWEMSEDVVEVGAAGVRWRYAGRLERKSATLLILTTTQGQQVRLRRNGDDWFVAAPGVSEFKATECVIQEGQRTEIGRAFDDYFSANRIADLERFTVRTHAEAARRLASRAKAADALHLLACAHLAVLLRRPASEAERAEIDALIRDLGLRAGKGLGLVGTGEGLAIHDFRRWLSDGEYDLGCAQFRGEYGSSAAFCVRYAHGFLLLVKAVEKGRSFDKAYEYLEKNATRQFPEHQAAHLKALAKSLRAVEVCRACTGEGAIRCNICRGKGRADFQCNTCGGSGRQIDAFRGKDVKCNACQGVGTWRNRECPKCKATGRMKCKGRGCSGPKPVPKLEDVFEAVACEPCRTRGLLLPTVPLVCPDCQGIGAILLPKADPRKTIR
ncbi:MAG: hypothetical protein HYY17_16440 [Planctomycetes bacterium]|nr:hypothetical protein [Planctomycetota bacterium]